jgi:hypothetical protein
MKLVATKQDALDVKTGPKTIDRDNWQDLRVAADHEAIHRDWKCALYRLHRIGRINNDQREAGDKYTALIRDRRKLWAEPMGKIEVYRSSGHEHLERRSQLTADVEFALGHVVADGLVEESEFEIKRAKRINDRYKEAKAIAGIANSILEDLLIDDIWPTSQRCHVEIGHALTRLSHFFNTGNKRATRGR